MIEFKQYCVFLNSTRMMGRLLGMRSYSPGQKASQVN